MVDRRRLHHEPSSLTLGARLWNVNWVLVFLVILVACIGFAMLFSAADGRLEPWAGKQMQRFAFGLGMMLVIALVDVRFWLRGAYIIYGIVLLLLLWVELGGFVGMGARRWLSLGPFLLQPSEMMKIALVLCLARYFHRLDEDQVNRFFALLPPCVIIGLPVLLVLRQPDLGTALMIAIGGVTLCFAAGIALWKFAAVAVAGLAAIPLAWQFLHEYQRQRVLTFLDPERDPLGTGYHILQSKIALGSGGVFGKGYMAGTQSHLNFLPEKQTDFIFTMIAEEFGMAGGLFLLAIYAVVLAYGFSIALRCQYQFGRLLALGVTSTLFLYAFINVAMVMGILPVVGVPLPLISYGGTAMMTLMFGFGLLLGVSVHRDLRGDRGQGLD